MTDLIKRDDALAAIDTALNNATGDLFDCHAAIRALPAIDPAAIREAALQARIKELVKERDDLRNFDYYFRSVCGFKRDGRDSLKCLDDFLAGINRQDIPIPFDHFLQVQKERDEARIAINQIGEAMGVLGIVQCLDDIVAEAKKRFAKLTKAVAGLRKIADHKHFSLDQGWIQNTEARIAIATLAELEGQ